jgi:hypothetical protein
MAASGDFLMAADTPEVLADAWLALAYARIRPDRRLRLRDRWLDASARCAADY